MKNRIALLVDGDYLYRTPKNVLGRNPKRDERLNYTQLYKFVERQMFGTSAVNAYYFQQNHKGAEKLYRTLENIGFELYLTRYNDGWQPVKEAILDTLLDDLHETDCDIVFVGGDSYQKQIEKQLMQMKYEQPGRRIGIVTLKGNSEFDAPDFHYFDIALDVGAMPKKYIPRNNRTIRGKRNRRKFSRGTNRP